ncbi:MarR family transcriptional regulator [uncultured Paracoccus sp.]|uniref:MarR family winged helix-turn-helix transcriptional regulator n=1 Tax=uncultured Paracoccus sp. TaxID=189685 RepID=UPI00262BA8C9|nr:MarR family transcriptional regulator [uncultured Paracoccus sp.]
MESSPLLNSLFRAMRELRLHYDQSAVEVGLTMSRARVITALARMEGATQAELAADLGIEAPTLKRQIDALEEQGFLERRGMEGDARKRALFLTVKGRSARISLFMDRIRDEVLEGVSPEEQVQLAVVLERIAENAAKLNR